MFPELALKLVSIFEAYSTNEEIRELADLFEVPIAALENSETRWLSVARELMTNLEKGNTRRLIDSFLDLVDSRNSEGIAHTSWETLEFHRDMIPVIRKAKELLETSVASSEISVPAGSTFSAKSRVRELLETATTDILIVDPYLGLGTLDCLRNVAVSIRLLTGSQPNSIENDFDRALVSFSAEGHYIQVRRGQQLHDRHIVFNDRCWLVGGSLKDAGKKPFNCIEMTDEKSIVVADLNAKWQAGNLFP